MENKEGAEETRRLKQTTEHLTINHENTVIKNSRKGIFQL